MAEEYVCTLNEASQKKAKEELHEDPKERLSSVATFKEWIVAQPHVKCAGGTKYLLRFLRASKFSQLVARQKLEKWLAVMDIMSNWLRDIDLRDPKLMELYDTGLVMALPGTDKDGCKVCIHRPGQLDVSGRFTKDQTVKALIAVDLMLSMDENVQVNGVKFMIDLTGFEMKQLTYFGLDDMKKMSRLWTGALPGRFKGFHFYNGGPVFDIVLGAIMPILSKKFKERFIMHGNNLENIYKVIPMEMLPEDYLPDDYTGKSAGTFKGIIEKMKKDLTTPDVVNQIKFETGQDFSVDASSRIEYEQASFRKLNID